MHMTHDFSNYQLSEAAIRRSVPMGEHKLIVYRYGKKWAIEIKIDPKPRSHVYRWPRTVTTQWRPLRSICMTYLQLLTQLRSTPRKFKTVCAFVLQNGFNNIVLQCGAL